jgi:phytoene dehydrogenase-like protein
LKLTSPNELPADFVDEIRNYRTYSSAFKINLALDGLPRYAAFDKSIGLKYPSYVHIGPSIDYLEKAYDDAKYGRPSEQPFMSPMVPTIVDPELAPEGKHQMTIFGGHAPYELQGTTWDQQREKFADRAIDTLSEYIPNLKDIIIDRQILVPPDLERIYGLPQGHIFHGELTLDQLFFMRPVPGYADYRSPIRKLYQCGSSTHPGGGVMGMCGHNAAREVLRTWSKR